MAGVAPSPREDLPSWVAGIVARSKMHVLVRRSVDHNILVAIIVGSIGGVCMLAALILGILLFIRRRSDREARAISESEDLNYTQSNIPPSPGNSYNYNLKTPNEKTSFIPQFTEETTDGDAQMFRQRSMRRMTADQSLWFSEAGLAEQRPATQNFSLPRRSTTVAPDDLDPQSLDRSPSAHSLRAHPYSQPETPPPLPAPQPVAVWAPQPVAGPSRAGTQTPPFSGSGPYQFVGGSSPGQRTLSPSTSTPNMSPRPSVNSLSGPDVDMSESAALASRAARLRAASPPQSYSHLKSPSTSSIKKQRSDTSLRAARQTPSPGSTPVLSPAPLPQPPPSSHSHSRSTSQTKMISALTRQSSLSPDAANAGSQNPTKRQTRPFVSASEDVTLTLAGRPPSRFSVSPVAKSFPSILGRMTSGGEGAATGIGAGSRKSRHTRMFGSDSR
ncbi:hypothetical protein MKEN_00027800 [Mycena kentingensis (nom. inval.)]|nr:hypothetical protein MKEN_00027800 [Mycena kentingensis (nom. inval.)]